MTNKNLSAADIQRLQELAKLWLDCFTAKAVPEHKLMAAYSAYQQNESAENKAALEAAEDSVGRMETMMRNIARDMVLVLTR